MKLDFSDFPLSHRAFSTRPMTFCEPAAVGCLSAVIELVALETGNRRARERWQTVQLRNLLTHAAQRSAFWKRRLGTKKISDLRLSSLPVLTRSDLCQQVQGEGPLLTSSDPLKIASHSTSGSSGTPVNFFVSEMNGRYNAMRYLAQYLMEGRDLSVNRTRLQESSVSVPNGFTVRKTESWLGDLSPLVRCGLNKHIDFLHPHMKLLRKELEAQPNGYLVAGPSVVEAMLSQMDPAFLKRAGTVMYIVLGNAVDPRLRETLTSLGIPVRATYSSEEVGPIGMECEKHSGYYHVATSNVIVELDKDDQYQLENRQLGRVLVTHLHSYATPFIRYEIGDLATAADRCVCGYDGPTLSNLYGRKKCLLKLPDGRLQPFFVRSYDMTRIAPFDEFRIRQTTLDTVIVEIAREQSLSPGEKNGFKTLIERHVDDGIAVEVRWVAKINWGGDSKRLGFRSEVL